MKNNLGPIKKGLIEILKLIQHYIHARLLNLFHSLNKYFIFHIMGKQLMLEIEYEL